MRDNQHDDVFGDMLKVTYFIRELKIQESGNVCDDSAMNIFLLYELKNEY